MTDRQLLNFLGPLEARLLRPPPHGGRPKHERRPSPPRISRTSSSSPGPRSEFRSSEKISNLDSRLFVFVVHLFTSLPFYFLRQKNEPRPARKRESPQTAIPLRSRSLLVLVVFLILLVLLSVLPPPSVLVLLLLSLAAAAVAVFFRSCRPTAAASSSSSFLRFVAVPIQSDSRLRQRAGPQASEQVTRRTRKQRRQPAVGSNKTIWEASFTKTIISYRLWHSVEVTISYFYLVDSLPSHVAYKSP